MKSIESHGESLAVGLGIVASDAFDDGALEIKGGAARFLPPGQTPDDLARRGVLFRHLGTLAAPGQGNFVLGWFWPTEAVASLEAKLGSAEAAADKFNTLAFEFSENLASDKFQLSETVTISSEDLWADYLSGDLPREIAWHRFTLSGTDHPDWLLYFAWPRPVLERMFGPPPPAPAASSSPAPAATAAKSAAKLSPTVSRLLRTEVPLIVTLASKMENAGKILHLGPGSIIEFAQSCDSPLQLSVNNLPIGLGEAVKIGDHFGLKIVEIVPTEERLERLGSKWPY